MSIRHNNKIIAGVYTEELHQKANTDLSNTSSNIDYVIEYQAATPENGNIWYRKYKSGWVEQGSYQASIGLKELPIEMASSYYSVTVSVISQDSVADSGVYINSTTQIHIHNSEDLPMSWEVKGMSKSNGRSL